MRKTWTVEVWTTPKGRRYRDAHPEHRQKLLDKGLDPESDIYCGTVESIGCVFSKTFYSEAPATKEATRQDRLARGTVEIIHGFTI